VFRLGLSDEPDEIVELHRRSALEQQHLGVAASRAAERTTLKPQRKAAAGTLGFGPRYPLGDLQRWLLELRRHAALARGTEVQRITLNCKRLQSEIRPRLDPRFHGLQADRRTSPMVFRSKNWEELGFPRREWVATAPRDLDAWAIVDRITSEAPKPMRSRFVFLRNT
jgi:hypothetical protein